MRIGRLLFACLFLAPGFVLAQNEGVATFRLTTHSSTTPDGRYSISFSRSALRMEMQMDAAAGGRPNKGGSKTPSAGKATMIQKLAEPDILYMVSDEQKTYWVIDLAKLREQSGKQAEDAWTIKRLGRDSVAGYACEKALLTSSKGASKGAEIEVCVAADLPVSSAWWSAMYRAPKGSDRWMKTIQEAGIKGLPIRVKLRSAHEATGGMEMELVSLEKKSLPGSLFEIPKGYRKVESGSGVSTMTPEQRKAYEDAKKKAQEKQ